MLLAKSSKEKTGIEVHCATEAATLELTLKENVEHLEATVGNLINSKRHKALMDKKITVAISELLGKNKPLELSQSNNNPQTKVSLLFTTVTHYRKNSKLKVLQTYSITILISPRLHHQLTPQNLLSMYLR